MDVANAVFSGLVLLLGALTTFTAARSRRVAVDRRQYRRLQRQNVAAFGHIYALESAMSIRGIPVPARPAELEVSDDDDPQGAAPLPVPPPLPLPPSWPGPGRGPGGA